MTDRENLTALLMAGAGDCLGKGGVLNCSKLADYLLEHGVVVPQCKVGDTVYQIDAERVFKSKVKAFVYVTENIAFDERAIGKTVFLTREEAEKALKERTKQCQE